MAKCTFSFSKNCEVSKMSWTAKSESSGSIFWSTQGHNFCRRLSFLRPAISVHRHERKLRHPPTHRASTTTMNVLEIHIAQIRATIKVTTRHSYWWGAAGISSFFKAAKMIEGSVLKRLELSSNFHQSRWLFSILKSSGLELSST